MSFNSMEANWLEPDDSPFDAAIEAGWINPEDVSKAMLDVMDERVRTETVEGFSSEQDDRYIQFELGKAAASYLAVSIVKEKTRADWLKRRFAPGTWPWQLSWWKPKDRRRDLVRAAALIVAEIERLDRQTAREAASAKEKPA